MTGVHADPTSGRQETEADRSQQGGIDRFLRRFSVRGRIVSGFLILVALAGLTVPLTVANQSFVTDRLRQITEVETRADRLLLLASTRIESSRVNLMRYVQDYAPSAYQALDDVDQATGLLAEAQGLIALPEQQATLATLSSALADYRELVGEVQAARSQGQEQAVSQILFQAYRLGNDIGQRIEQVVRLSEGRVAAANQTVYDEAQRRLILLLSGYAGLGILGLVLAYLVQRSITEPVADLRRGAEAFRQGEMQIGIPVVGADELTLLARTFNELAAQVGDLIGTLEQRVADRTRTLERRAVELATAAGVGRAAASILDLGALTRQVVELVRDGFGLYYTGLFLMDERGEFAVLEAGTGEAGRRMKEAGHRLEVGGMSMVGAACARRAARIALDVGQEAVRFDNPLLPDTRSEMALPLVAGDRVLGALDVQSSEPAAFSQEDIAVLQLVADQVAVAIANARLFGEVQSALEAERRAYGEIGRESWARLSRGQVGLGYYSDERGVAPVTLHRTNGAAGEVGQAHGPEVGQAHGPAPTGGAGKGHPDDTTGKALPEKHRHSAALRGTLDGETALAPIKVRDEVVGVIDARKPQGSGRWTAEELEVLETLTDQLGVALDGARLYQETQRRVVQERLTAEVTARMRQTLDVDAVLRTAVQEMGAALGLGKVEVRMGLGTLAVGEAGQAQGPEVGQAQGPEAGQAQGPEAGQAQGPEAGQAQGPEAGQAHGPAPTGDAGEGDGDVVPD
ncbi:MAG: GAF domain-containing protein [Anaerolineae bacterium]|nr:GAF domain-containing protein [Anaerolineae bacterium]